MFPVDEYKRSAKMLRERLRMLRAELAAETSPEKAFWLKRRIRDLEPMLTQTNELIFLMENFYTIGNADRAERYGFNDKQKPKKVKKADAQQHLRRT